MNIFKTYLLLSILLSFLFKTNAQDTTFIYTYGGSSYDEGRSVQQTTDGGFIIAGSTSSGGAGSSDVYLIKIDSLGNFLWSKTYGGANVDWGYSVQQTIDGGYIIAGYTNSFGAGGYDAYLIKTDSIGDTLWTKTYGGSDWDFAYSVLQTADTGYILVGETYSYGNGDNDVYLIKTDPVGDTLWTKTYGGTNSDFGKSVQQTFDSGFIIAGGTESYGAGESDIYLIKTNNIGDTLWTNTYGGIEIDYANSVIQTNDTGFAIVGASKSFNGINLNYYLLKTDNNGNTLWFKDYDGILITDDDEARQVKQTPNGGYAFINYTKSSGGSGKEFQFIITDALGTIILGPTLGGIKDDEGFSFDFTYDGGYVLLGTTNSDGNGLTDILIYKTDSTGVTATNFWIVVLDTTLSILNSVETRDNMNLKKVLILPNPFSDKAIIITHFKANKINIEFKVYDLLGKEIICLKNITNKIFEIDGEHMPNGIYIYEITNNSDLIGKGKLVIH